MKFKEIKPEMVIHCPKEEDARSLSEYLIKLGIVNANRIMEYYGLDNGVGKVDTVLITQREGKLYVEYSDRRWFEKDEYHMKITEFSDLIEPDENLANKANDLANSLDNQDNDLDNQRDNEMSAVEVLEWIEKACDDENLMQSIFGDGCENCDDIFGFYSPKEILEQITAYEASKKEKPVEVEWVDICRIIQMQDNGVKKCMYEEVLKPETPFDTDPDLKEQAEAILKKYISEHEGWYIAVIEDVCRVKGE